MKINVEKENLEKLAQIIYLGDIVINGYKKSNELKTDCSILAEDIYGQILENLPQVKSKYKYKNMPTHKSIEAKISDFRDNIYDTVKDYLSEYHDALFFDMLIEQNK